MRLLRAAVVEEQLQGAFPGLLGGEHDEYLRQQMSNGKASSSAGGHAGLAASTDTLQVLQGSVVTAVSARDGANLHMVVRRMHAALGLAQQLTEEREAAEARRLARLQALEERAHGEQATRRGRRRSRR